MDQQEPQHFNESPNQSLKQDIMDPNRSRRFYLITHPRSASNLLVRILSLGFQHNVLYRQKGGYFFLPTGLLGKELKTEGRHVKEWTQDEKTRILASYQDDFNEMEEYLEKAQTEGKTAFVKEHSGFITHPLEQTKFLFGDFEVERSPWKVTTPARYGIPSTSDLNKTIFPDEFLQTWLPIFLVRHPALAFPSYYRTQLDLKLATKKDDKQLELWMTLHWSRTLYDWYSQKLCDSISERETWPIVLDAEDVTHRPEVLIRLCEIVGMDPTKLQFSWKPMSKEDVNDLIPNVMERRFLSTVLASSGVIKEKTSINIDIDIEAKKWKEEFGEDMGEQMERWVRAAMPDYEYMTTRRLSLFGN